MRMPIADLTPNASNPRKITDKRKAQLRKSLEQFGNLSPITWNKTTGRVIGGNQRLEGYRDLGHTHVDVWVVELPKSKEKLAMVALNNHASQWDDDKLSELIASLNKSGEDLELTGFESVDLEKILKDIEPPGEPSSTTAAPGDFKTVDQTIHTDHICPKCGYKFSGGAKE